MQFEDLEPNQEPNEEEQPIVEESSNRTFFIIAGILGAVALLALICIAVYVAVLLPNSKLADLNRAQTMQAQDTETGMIVAGTATSAAATAIVAAYTATPTNTPIPPTATPTLTPTPVVAVPTTPAAVALDATKIAEGATATARYVTLEAIVTANASTTTARPPQATSQTNNNMPSSGFAEDVGLPAMLGLAVLLIVIIFLARRLRTAS